MFSPHQRGIYCDDTSISYPYRKDTISHGTMAAVTIICSIVIVSLHPHAAPRTPQGVTSPPPFAPQITTGEAYLVHTKRLHSNSQFNQYLSALYKVVGTFLFGAAVSQSLTDLAKFTIGRPRPNFLSVCAPVSCNGYVLHINCTGNPRNVTESRWAAFAPLLRQRLVFWSFIRYKEDKTRGSPGSDSDTTETGPAGSFWCKEV